MSTTFQGARNLHTALSAHIAGDDAEAASLQAASLIASLRPGINPHRFAPELGRVTKQAAKIDPSGKVLGALAHDARFPGWARLFVALHTTDADLIASLERYTVPLIGISGLGSLYGMPGAGLLPTLRRVQLAAAGKGVDIELEDLEAHASSIAHAKWTHGIDVAQNLARRVRLRAQTLSPTLGRILDVRVGEHTERLHLLLLTELVTSTRALDGVTDLRNRAVEAFTILATREPIPAMSTPHEPSLLVALFSSHRPEHRALGAALLHSTAEDQLTAAVLAAAVGTCEGTAALADRRHLRAGVFGVLAHMLAAHQGLTQDAVRLLVRHRDEIFRAENEPALRELLAQLGSHAWVLGYLFAPTAASAHNYGSSSVAAVPAALKAAVITGAWIEPDESDAQVLTWLPAQNTDTLDRARAYLCGAFLAADRRFVPTDRIRGRNPILTKDLVFALAYGHRNSSFRDQTDHWAGWLRALSAPDFAEVVTEVVRVHARTDDSYQVPTPLAQVLDEAFAAAGNDDAASALASALTQTRSFYGHLPATMTIIEYATALRHQVTKAPVRI